VFFAGPVGLYLIATRRWRDIFSWPHACGLLIFVVLWNAWQIPYCLHAGLDATWRIYGDDVARRFEDRSLARLLTHLAVYPGEIFACLLPWSPLLVVCCRGTFWNWLKQKRPYAVFLACCLVATFPVCWFVPGARGRYYMPLCPCFAVLIGLAAEHCWQSAFQGTWRSAWRQLLAGLAIAMGMAAGALVLINLVSHAERVAQPWNFVVAFFFCSLLLASIVWWSAAGLTAAQRRAGPIAVAAFLGLAHIGVATNIRDHLSNDTQQQVAALKQKLPARTRLVSLGRLHHTFTFYFEQPIEPLDDLPADRSWPGDTDYFCFKPLPGEAERLEFRWEQIAEITCDRNRRSSPDRIVVVGRRLRQRPAVSVVSHTEPAIAR
jgi:4-amino-4-deoxy-L-arabinose transferase-like glycosyltransferase